jgi:membrane fusion protein (multidrug efflux system)
VSVRFAASRTSCLLVCLLGLAACKPAARTAPPSGPPDVIVRIVKPESVALRSELPGRTTAWTIAEIRPQVSGIVRKRLFTEGATVKAGQVLYEIDPEPFAAAAEQQAATLADAEAAAKLAELQERRYRTLLPQGTVSQQDYDTASATLAQAQARVRLAQAASNAARISLRWTQVASPVAGRTGRSLVTPGALVSANQADPLTTVSQLDPIYVDVTQSSAELLRLRMASQSGRLQRAGTSRIVRLTLEDGTPYPHEGKLELAEVTVDPSTGSVALRAVFPNPEGLLLPGMYVRAVLDEGVDPQAIRLPQEVVTRDRKGNATVRIVDGENRLQVRPVTVSRAIDTDWLVDGGLAAGDRVVIEGANNARPGSEVHVVDAP